MSKLERRADRLLIESAFDLRRGRKLCLATAQGALRFCFERSGIASDFTVSELETLTREVAEQFEDLEE